MSSLTALTGCFLLEFSDSRELQVVHAFLFLLIYATSLLGNLLLIILVTLDHCLHTPCTSS